MNTVLVRTSSHRSRGKLERLLGVDRLESYYTWRDGGVFVMIPASMLDAARKIKGVTKAKPKGKIGRCWPGGGL